MKEKTDILELFSLAKSSRSRGYVNVSAPMVRYSKLEFRTLLRNYDVDLCFTPMIIADSFVKSTQARRIEFTTNSKDSPLIVQFASNTAKDILLGSQLVFPYADGVDLNCGCPQRWAIASGYGCALLKNPNLLHDIVRTLKRNLPNSFSISTKLRLIKHSDNLATTAELCRQLEMCDVTFITVHGRFPKQRSSEPVNIEGLRTIKDVVRIPVVANGGVKNLEDVQTLYEQTKCDGIMGAQGLLTNPTLFTGQPKTTLDCLQNWIDLAYAADSRITFQIFHHHLTFMMEKLTKKSTRVVFNNFSTKGQIYDFLKEEFNIEPRPITDYCDNINCSIYETENDIPADDPRLDSNGKFFTEFCNSTKLISNENYLDFMESSMFDV